MIPFPTGWKVNPKSMVPNHQPDFVCPILGIDAFPCSFSQLKRCSIENLVLLVWEVNFGSGYIIGLLQAKIYIHNFTGTPEPPCISWGKKNMENHGFCSRFSHLNESIVTTSGLDPALLFGVPHQGCHQHYETPQLQHRRLAKEASRLWNPNSPGFSNDFTWIYIMFYVHGLV